MMIRLLPVVLLFATHTAAGQVYFEGLYGDSVGSGEGISTEGTVTVADGYLSWAYVGTRKTPFMFQVGLEGNLIASDYLEKEDTVALWARNVIKMNDTLFAGGIWRQVQTEPSVVQGDHGLAVFTLQGQVISERYYGLPDRMEYPSRVQRTQDGGFAFVGQVISGTAPNDNGNVHLLKTDSAGNQLWEKEYGGTLDDMGRDVVGTPDGGFLILGWTRSFGAGQQDFYLVKTDSNGDQQWQQTYGGVENEIGWSIIVLDNENYLLTGGGGGQGFLYEVDSNGIVVWNETYESGSEPVDFLFKSVQLGDGSIVSCGLAENSGTGGNAGWIMKVTPTGELLWQRVFDKNQHTDLFYSMLATEDGGFLLSGQAVNEETNSQDAWLLKVDSVGCAYPLCIVGVDELGSREALVNVWPNPVGNILNVEITGNSRHLDLQVFDISGREILRFTQHNRRATLDTGHWNSGIYLLKGMDESSRMFNMKIVKQ